MQFDRVQSLHFSEMCVLNSQANNFLIWSVRRVWTATWWLEKNIYWVLGCGASWALCSMCVFDASRGATASHVASTQAPRVFVRRVCCMFTGLQCRAWWWPAEMMGSETQLCLWISPSNPWGTAELFLLSLCSDLHFSFPRWLFNFSLVPFFFYFRVYSFHLSAVLS